MSLETKIRNNYTFVVAEEILAFFKKFNLERLIEKEIEYRVEEINDGI